MNKNKDTETAHLDKIIIFVPFGIILVLCVLFVLLPEKISFFIRWDKKFFRG